MSIAFNGKGMASLLFNGKLAAQIFFGAKLIWQKIQKLLEYDFGAGQNNCYEITPTEDISLSSISAFAKYNNASDMTVRIINECGILIAESSQNGVASKADLYNLTGDDGGFMNTVSSLGTVTLFKGNKYYINVQKGGTGGWNLARYVGETGNYKSYQNVNHMSVLSGSGERKSFGVCSVFDDLKNIDVGYFAWTGGAIGNGVQPQQGSSNEPYPYLLKRNVSRVRHLFTDVEFNNVPVGQYNDDIARYAYIYYCMGNTIGDEFMMLTDYWNQGFMADPNSQTRYFDNNRHKICTTKWPFDHNKITSMTPVDNEPQSPSQWDIYYKSDANAWTGSVGKKRAVVTWNGSEWIAAVNWSAEWDVDSQYDASNYCEVATQDYTARGFMTSSLQTGSKWYFKANNIEV